MSDSIIDALLFGQKRAVAKAAGSVSSERLYGEATGINWCEKDYQVTPYICEFWNTCTNIVYVYFGLYCLRETWRLKLPRRFAWFSVFILLTGAFSALFHATLWMLGQKLDEIFESVDRTGRLLVIDTGWKTMGPGAEIVARATEYCFRNLKQPPRRLGLPDHPTPSSRSLAGAFYIRAEHIALAVGDLAGISPLAARRAADELSVERQTHPNQ